MNFDIQEAFRVWTREEEIKIRSLSRQVDKACRFILRRDTSEADVVLEEIKARNLCRELFPDKIELFDRIYASRFRRLRDQFRNRDA